MNLHLPIFSLKSLKQAFYYFLVFQFIIAGLGFWLGGVLSTTQYQFQSKIDSPIIFIAFVALSFIYSSRSKAELKKINLVPETDEKLIRYQHFFKSRLLWNMVFFSISALLLMITKAKFLSYFIVFQLLLSMIFYPRKSLVTKELNNSEILFT